AEKVGNEIQPVLRGCGERLRPTLKGHGGPAARVTSTVTVSAVSLRAARRERAGGRACSRLMVCVRVRTPGRRGGVRGKCRRTGRQPGRFAAVPWTAYARGEPAWRAHRPPRRRRLRTGPSAKHQGLLRLRCPGGVWLTDLSRATLACGCGQGADRSRARPTAAGVSRATPTTSCTVA